MWFYSVFLFITGTLPPSRVYLGPIYANTHPTRLLAFLISRSIHPLVLLCKAAVQKHLNSPPPCAWSRMQTLWSKCSFTVAKSLGLCIKPLFPHSPPTFHGLKGKKKQCVCKGKQLQYNRKRLFYWFYYLEKLRPTDHIDIKISVTALSQSNESIKVIFRHRNINFNVAKHVGILVKMNNAQSK